MRRYSGTRPRTTLTSASVEPIDTVVLDASVAINLLGTGVSRDILSVVPWRVVMERRARNEIRRHPIAGCDHAAELHAWEINDWAGTVSLRTDMRQTFDALTSGSLIRTLDDGEAATIAYAVGDSERTVPVIDEKKATKIFQQRWPNRRLLETADIFRALVEAELVSKRFASDAVYSALTHARMHVSHRMRPWVLDLIGRSRAAACPSLGRSA